MKLKEKCRNWNIEFDSEMDSIDTEEEEAFKGILHTAGDVVNIVASIPKEEKDLRKRLLHVVTFIVLEARNHIEASVEQTILNQAMDSPLEGKFSDEEVYGFDLVSKLMAQLETDKEKAIAEEILELDSTKEEDENDDEEIE